MSLPHAAGAVSQPWTDGVPVTVLSGRRGVGRIASVIAAVCAVFGFSTLPAWAAPAGTIVPGGTAVGWGGDGFDAAAVPPGLAGQTITAAAAGTGHVLVLTSTGTVSGWGDNSYGQLDIPASLAGQRVTAIAAASLDSLALTATGKLIAWGNNGKAAAQVPAELAGQTVTAIAAGTNRDIALTQSGTVVTWVGGWKLELPAEVAGQRVTAIAAGGNHFMALTESGRVLDWGTSVLPPAESLRNVTAIAAGGGNLSLALTADGTVTAWGTNDVALTDVPTFPPGDPVVAIAAGTDHALALTKAGKVYAWGGNDFGQSTVPASLPHVSAIAAGSLFSVAITAIPPVITTSPTAQHIPAGQPATFTAAAAGNPTPTVQWQQRPAGSSTWTDIPGATNPTYTHTTTAADTNSQYRAVFSNSAGTATTNPATLTITPTAPPTTSTPHTAATTTAAGHAGTTRPNSTPPVPELAATGAIAAPALWLTAALIGAGLTLLLPTRRPLSGNRTRRRGHHRRRPRPS
jgi:hypothetical protein